MFNNDAAQPFYLSLRRGEQIADFGRIPAATSSAPLIGSEQGQTMNGFQFAYTTREVRGRFGYVVTFYDRYGSGDSPAGHEVAARIRLLDLPGAPRAGVQANWKVTVDLRYTPYEFVLGRDDEGGGAEARFGWSLSCTNTKHGPGGPILAGDPLGTFGPAAAPGAGTDWSTLPDESGTGYGSEDAFWRHGRGRNGVDTQYVVDIPNAPISYGSFHLQLYANTDHALAGSTNIGTNYCDGSSSPVVFHDGFDSGDIVAGGWDAYLAVTVVQSSDWSGGWHARIGASSKLTKAVSTVGYEHVKLRYSRRADTPSVNRQLIVEWWDGVTWNLLENTSDDTWATLSFDLPPSAAGNPDFKVRFKCAGFGGGAAVEAAFFDDVWIDAEALGHIEAFGSTSIADNDVTLVASGLPVDSFGLFFFGPEDIYTPLGIGFRCVGGAGQQRLLPILQADASGATSRDLDFTTHPVSSSFIAVAPVTGNFQYWHRKSGSNTLTDALRIHLVE